MSLKAITLLFADAAPAGAAAQPTPADFLRGPLIPMIVIMAVFFWIMQRSQSKKVKEHEAMLKTLKPGDKITTSSGIIGVVLSVKEKTVSLRSADTKLEILKSAVGDVFERAGETTEAKT